MRWRNITIIVLMFLAQNCFACSDSVIAKKIGWVASNYGCSLCGGYYKDFSIPYLPNPFVNNQSKSFNISAEKTNYSLKTNQTTLSGSVRIARQNEEIQADSASARASKNGKIISVNANDNVRYHTPGKLVIAKKAEVDFLKNNVILHNVIYRIARSKGHIITIKKPNSNREEKHLYQLNGWGVADIAEQINKNLIKFKNVSYQTCPPTKNGWKIKAGEITLNKNSGRGDAKNALFLVKNVPVFYLPYFSFPINKNRHSGFLFPTFSHRSNGGYALAVPYYLDLAPNYDATITPTFFSRRGVLFGGLFRYLTAKDFGHLRADYIYSDRDFKKFKNSAATIYAGNVALNRLLNSSDDRLGFSFANHSQLNSLWSSDINFNYVSDDYFIRDFGKDFDNSDDQLLQQAKLQYSGINWNFLGNLLNYQTLHRVDQSVVSEQYAKLPQLQLNAYYPDIFHGLNFSLNDEYIYFKKLKNPGDAVSPLSGSRISIRPALSLPLSWPFAFITPRVQFQMTKYFLQNSVAPVTKNPGIIVPIFDVKAGLFFDKSTQLFSREYRQTLEPVFYYLYVPYRGQNQIPIFDTSLQTFNYDYMFSPNRFSGVDRIGDANQFTLGATTNLFDAATGEKKASASIGQIYYFQNRNVLLPGVAISSKDTTHYSPIAFAGQYNLNPLWSTNLNLTWDPSGKVWDNQHLGLQYKPNANYILNFGYDFVKDLSANDSSKDLKQTDIIGYWKFSSHWGFMGRWNYSWNLNHAQTYFYGLAYEGCCFAARFVVSRTFTGLSQANNPQFDRAISFEIALKGLSDFGSGDIKSFLENSISGYKDNFGQEN